MPTFGLVLTGGGARAAYQAGALSALSEILGEKASPFRVIAGTSAGAINGVAVASGADDFAAATSRLSRIWMGLRPDLVYRTDVPTLASIGAGWARELTSLGRRGRPKINYLLDTAPLRQLLEETLRIERLEEHFRAGRLRGVGVTATNYATGTAVTFYDGAPDIRPWVRSTRLAQRETLRIDHVMVSAAIPLFFLPVRLHQTCYGDGCIRMSAPASPAIHLGAERVVAIGVRYLRSGDETLEINRNVTCAGVPPSQIAGVVLNAVFLDSLETDLERMQRINRTLAHIAREMHAVEAQPLRQIPVLVLRPTRDLGQLATEAFPHMPRGIRYVLAGIGGTGAGGADLLSYLAFQPEYVGRLIELGRRDTLARREEIEDFFRD